ncbi:MAG: hypothetical protein LBL76_07155 [Treponema sp.]|jgi:hypothetical protein|nr:hypothetical protein [Treponema sp.]
MNTRSIAKILGIVLLVWGGAELKALPDQKIVYPGEWVYEALGILSQEQGIVFFMDSSLTVGQMRFLLQAINEEALSPSGQILYDRITDYLQGSPGYTVQADGIQAEIDGLVQPELYVKTNPALDWLYNYHQRRAFFMLPVSISLGSYITAEMDPYFGQNEYAASLHENYINIPWDMASQADLHIPKRAYLSMGVPFGKASGVHLSIGIGDDFFGRTRTGSIILSEYLERVNYAQLSFFSPIIRYAAEVMQYEVNKYHYMHYLQFRPHRRISLSFAEGAMVNAPLELRYLNPLMIFHSYEGWKTYNDYNAGLNPESVPDLDDEGSRVGAFFGAKIEYHPWKYLRLYGLFAMTQLQLPLEHRLWEDLLTPDALAFQGGIEVSLPSSRGYWNFGLEGVYTYPYMYLKEDKGWSYYKEMVEMDRIDVRYWTGTPFGPDSIAATLWGKYQRTQVHPGSVWSCGFSLVFAAQGENSSTAIFDTDAYQPTHAVMDVTRPPTGIPTYTYTLTLLGTWSPLEWLQFSLQPGYKIVSNYGHEEDRLEQGFELSFSARIRPVTKLKQVLSKPDTE